MIELLPWGVAGVAVFMMWRQYKSLDRLNTSRDLWRNLALTASGEAVRSNERTALFLSFVADVRNGTGTPSLRPEALDAVGEVADRASRHSSAIHEFATYQRALEEGALTGELDMNSYKLVAVMGSSAARSLLSLEETLRDSLDKAGGDTATAYEHARASLERASSK